MKGWSNAINGCSQIRGYEQNVLNIKEKVQIPYSGRQVSWLFKKLWISLPYWSPLVHWRLRNSALNIYLSPRGRSGVSSSLGIFSSRVEKALLWWFKLIKCVPYLQCILYLRKLSEFSTWYPSPKAEVVLVALLDFQIPNFCRARVKNALFWCFKLIIFSFLKRY